MLRIVVESNGLNACIEWDANVEDILFTVQKSIASLACQRTETVN